MDAADIFVRDVRDCIFDEDEITTQNQYEIQNLRNKLASSRKYRKVSKNVMTMANMAEQKSRKRKIAYGEKRVLPVNSVANEGFYFLEKYTRQNRFSESPSQISNEIQQQKSKYQRQKQQLLEQPKKYNSEGKWRLSVSNFQRRTHVVP